MGDWQKILDDFSGSSKTTSSKSKPKTSTSSSKKKKDDWQSILDDFSGASKTTTTPVTTKKKDSGLDFFQKGAFEDGYQFGDISMTVGSSLGDLILNAGKGAAGMAEGLVDLGAYGVAAALEAEGRALGDKEKTKRADDIRKRYQKNAVDDFFAPMMETLDENSVFGRTSDSIAQAGGQIASIILTGGAAGAAGVSATAATTGMMGLSGMGSGMSQAYQEGATDSEALTYGAISGAADALSELMFGGLGKAVKGVGLSHGAFGLDDMLARKVSGIFKNQIAKNIAEAGIKAGGEGFEEVVAGTAQAIGKKLTYADEKELSELLKDENLLEQFIVGAVASGISQAPSVHHANTSGTDFVTGFTQDEQAVIDKEIENRIAEQEQDGKKLTKREKNAIAEQVERDLDRGYISIDTIEETLGDRTYLDSLQKEADEFNTLYNTASGQLSKAQQNRLAELEVKNTENSYEDLLKTEKGKFSQGVFDRVKGSRLAESYNERTRRGQAFEADLTKYNEAQKAVVQKAIDSGILNNTNRTHEFVDMVAKISADKGVLFDFTNNEKLKTSGFAVDGATVNGYFDRKNRTVGVNINSAKALNTVVGHEITHVLEGTEIYKELQTAVFNYAKAKGDYQSRYDSLAALYKDVEEDIDGELTADLVGDYLFTDENFINRLSTENRNVSQKLYDEVKYLLRVATAGGKEARELEKVKIAFEKAFKKAYKESSKAQGEGTKLSLSDNLLPNQAMMINIMSANVVNDARKNNISLEEYYTATENINAFNPTKADALLIADALEPVVDQLWNATYIGYIDKIRSYAEDDAVSYSLSDSNGKQLTSELDGEQIAPERVSENEIDTQYSLSFAKDIVKGQNDWIAKNQSKAFVDAEELAEAQRVTAAMVDVMMKYSNILPEDKIGKVITKNGSYDRSIENTTICVRTLAYNEFVDKVQEQLGRPLTQMESFLVSQKLYDIATEPQCLYCYVSLDRKAYNDMLLRYMNDRDTVIGKYKASDKTPATIEALYEEFLHGRKPTKEMRKRFNDWIGYVDNDIPLLSLADIATEASQANINSKGGSLATQLKDARKYAQSASWAKIQKDYVAYRDEILKLSDKVVKDLNSHYGMRWYSFSDYSAAFIVENMQQITDASIRGLKGLSYTKDTDFAEIFAPTGMNINISVFVNQDANGNFYIDERQSAVFEEAKRLRAQYPNVGIVATVTNDDALRWAASQEWSDVIIPFHIVRTGTDVAEYYKWLNYTGESGDTVSDKSLWDAYVDSLNIKSASGRKKASKNIYPNEHKNDKTTYLTLCENRGLTPRFARFAGEDWYMKLVNETRLSADASTPLRPVFNQQAAEASFQKFVDKGGYEGGWYLDGVDVDAEAAIVAEDVRAGKKANEVEYGRQDGFVPEALMASRKTNRQHGRYSLSNGEQPTYGSYNIRGEDVALAPVEESAVTDDGLPIADDSDFAPVTADGYVMHDERELFPDDMSDMTDEYEADRMDSITENDVPPEMDAPYYEDYYEGKPAEVKDPFKERDFYEIGKQRNVKAYQYENPEVKPFFQSYAEAMLGDLRNSIKGEKIYNSQVAYEHGDEYAWSGQKRMTTEDIADLLDYGYTYAEIEKGLNDIIEDNGKENNAVAKRIEFMLNDRLMYGYTDINGYDVPANPDYIKLIEEKQISEYSTERAREAFAALDDADAPPEIAPIAAPMQQKQKTAAKAQQTIEAPIYDSKEKGAAKGQQTMFEPPKPNPKVATVLTEEKKKAKEKSGVGGKMVSALVDKGMVFENLSLETGNHELQAKYNSTLSSNTNAKAQYFMENGAKAKGVKSLKDIRKKVEKSGKTADFYDYLYHVHNADRMTLEDRFSDTPNKPVFGETVTADVSKRKAYLYEKANPEFKAMAEDIYKYNQHLRNLLVENGVISQETADLWQKMYPHYVPIRRVDTTGQNISVPLDTNKTGVNAPIKRATGGSSDIMPLFETMAMRTEQTYRAIARNAFGIELKNTLGTTIGTQTASVDDAIDMAETQDDLLKAGTMFSNPTFTVFENGERVEFEITEDMFEALKPANKILAHRSKTLTGISNFRRNLLTVWNPVFALYRNPIKDIQDVAINSQHAAKTYMNVPNAIKQMLTGGEYATEYHQNGGKSNTYFDSRTNQFKAEDNIFKKTIGLPIRAIETAGEFIEEIPRLAEYIASRQEGRSIDRSMLDAARVTTNFAAGGDFTKFLNSHGFTFLNASVQGASQHVRNFREAKQEGLKGYVKVLAKYTIAGLPTILLNGMLWDDDDEYEELSDYVKQNYYVVAKTEGGKFVRIPKGRTAAVMGELFEQMQNRITGNDEADFSTFFELFMNNIAPSNPIENNILAPIGQAISNTAWYGGDLVPSRLQDLPAEEQYDESTDSISKWLGEKTGLSPYKLNYLIDQYSGGAGDVFLPMLTPEAESGDNSFVGNLLAPWKKEMTTDKVLNNKYPGDFYDLKNELKVKANSSKATDEDILRSMYMTSVSSEMGALYGKKREIQNSDMTDAQKYKEVRKVQEQINAIAERGLNSYENINIDGKYATIGDRRFDYSDYSDRWYEIEGEYLEREQAAIDRYGITPSEYWNDTDLYYNADKFFKYKQEMEDVAKMVYGGKRFAPYAADMGDIDSKDESGNSVNGLKKKRIINYINSQSNLDYGEKIIMLKMNYPADDSYNYDIIDYLNNRSDISYSEMVTILESLDMKVSADGTVTWK